MPRGMVAGVSFMRVSEDECPGKLCCVSSLEKVKSESDASDIAMPYLGRPSSLCPPPLAPAPATLLQDATRVEMMAHHRYPPKMMNLFVASHWMHAPRPLLPNRDTPVHSAWPPSGAPHNDRYRWPAAPCHRSPGRGAAARDPSPHHTHRPGQQVRDRTAPIIGAPADLLCYGSNRSDLSRIKDRGAHFTTMIPTCCCFRRCMSEPGTISLA